MTATTVLTTDISEKRTSVTERWLFIVEVVDFNNNNFKNTRIPYIFLCIMINLLLKQPHFKMTKLPKT